MLTPDTGVLVSFRLFVCLFAVKLVLARSLVLKLYSKLCPKKQNVGEVLRGAMDFKMRH